jgi:hypothetical protein
MGMFDWYQPYPPLSCPVCGIELKEWQGKEGPCALFVWRQGTAGPVDQLVEAECRLSDDRLMGWRLPETFFIYSYDCERHMVLATGNCTQGTWTSTRIAEVRNCP